MPGFVMITNQYFSVYPDYGEQRVRAQAGGNLTRTALMSQLFPGVGAGVLQEFSRHYCAIKKKSASADRNAKGAVNFFKK